VGRANAGRTGWSTPRSLRRQQPRHDGARRSRASRPTRGRGDPARATVARRARGRARPRSPAVGTSVARPVDRPVGGKPASGVAADRQCGNPDIRRSGAFGCSASDRPLFDARRKNQRRGFGYHSNPLISRENRVGPRRYRHRCHNGERNGSPESGGLLRNVAAAKDRCPDLSGQFLRLMAVAGCSV